MTFVAIAVGLGFISNWSRVAIWCLCLLGVTGLVRLFSRQVKGFAVSTMARSISTMSAADRERELQRLSPEQRELVLKEIQKKTA